MGDTLWSDAKVPGTVHQNLLNHNRISNPFYGMNEEAVQWVENEDWMYRTSFVVNEQQLRIQVKPVLRKGVNHLLVRFRSAVKEVLPQLLTNGFEYPASNDHSPWRTSVYTRKAPYSYGWDWGIRLATCGIWRPVRLVFSDVARIEDYYVCQKSVSANRAKVDNRLEINNVTSRTVTALLKVDYHYSANDTKEISKRIELHPGENTVNLPARFEDLVYMGLVLQGQGMRHGIEAHRRNRPYCMGSLFWQLNDSWPVVSWSAIDYHGNWKALMYQSKRAFAPILIDTIREDNDLCVYLISDELHDCDDVSMTVELMDFDGKTHGRWTCNGRLTANSSLLFIKKPVGEWLGKQDAAGSLLHLTLKAKNGTTLADNIYYFAYPKDQKLPEARIETSVKRRGDSIEMTLKTDRLARDIFIEVPVQGVRFTDNFFDLLPVQRKKIVITSTEGHSLNDFTFRLHQLGGVR